MKCDALSISLFLSRNRHFIFRNIILVASTLSTILLSSATVNATDWKLVWSDEFERDGLPDPAVWDYECGYIRGKELQVYTVGRPENARVEKGMLVIEARHERFLNPIYDSKSDDPHKNTQYAEYTSASLITRPKKAWTYGRFEMRAQMPKGKGVWPAFWTLGENYGQAAGQTDWPLCGEIDIVEYGAKHPERISAAAHFELNKKHRFVTGLQKVDDPTTDFHIYAAEWFEDRIDYFYDDKKYFSFNTKDADQDGTNPFRKPHYVLINLALGGGLGGTMKGAEFPTQYLIDYVRVYQKSTAGSVTEKAVPVKTEQMREPTTRPADRN